MTAVPTFEFRTATACTYTNDPRCVEVATNVPGKVRNLRRRSCDEPGRRYRSRRRFSTLRTKFVPLRSWVLARRAKGSSFLGGVAVTEEVPMRLRGLSRRRRTWAATVIAGVVAAGLLSGPEASARPAPDPALTTMSIKSPPGGADVRVLIYYGSAAAGEESPSSTRASRPSRRSGSPARPPSASTSSPRTTPPSSPTTPG